MWKWLAPVVVSGLLASPPAGAQPASKQAPAVQSAEEDPVTEVGSSETAAQARRLFDAGRWGEAALLLGSVARGDSGDDERNRQIAEYRLGIALYRLRLYHASYPIFSGIADTPQHVKFDETLLWLAKLAVELPEPANVIERIGKYSPRQLGRFDNPEQRELYWHIHYLLGRYNYRNRSYEEALELFGKVGAASRYFIRAQFFSSISQVQLRRAEPAVQSLRRIMQAIEQGAHPVEESARMRDLALLSIARIYYSTATRLAENGALRIDGDRLNAAMEHWSRIDPAGESWLDGVYEQSWAYFMAGNYSHALGNLFTLQAPYFPNAFYPEAELLKATIAFKLCRYDDAATIVARMAKKYWPIKQELEILAGRVGDAAGEQKFFELANEARAGKVNLFPGARRIVENAFSDRQLWRHLDYVRMLDEEILRFKQAPASLRVSALGGDISDALQLARDLAVQNAGTLARQRYDRTLDELDARLQDAAAIFAHASSLARNAPLRPAAAGEIRVEDVTANDEHVIWPLQGEYWRDELDAYRQVVVSKCGR
jgi:TolA-binding protein